MLKKYKISGIDCANCARELEEKMKRIEGVKSLKLSFMMEKITVEFDDELKDDIKNRLIKVARDFEKGIVISDV